MNEKFFDVKKEKQDRIINAALKIFSQNGFRTASTDEIIREAGISKGLLFHYFGSKLGVFSFIYEYSVRYMTMELRAAVNPKETNFYAVYKQVELARLQALKGYPYMQAFLDRCDTENVSEAMMAITEKRSEYQDLIAAIDAQVDYSALGDDAQGQLLRNMFYFTVHQNMQKHFAEQSFQAEFLYEENVAYLTLLTKLLG